jgi:DNA-nicking Smr family endonuclease
MAKKAKIPSVPTLDLHGLREAEVFDKVDAFLRSPKAQKAPQVRIMPGKGKGIVQKKLIEYLKLGGFPWAYEKDGQGKVNEGVIVVYTG